MLQVNSTLGAGRFYDVQLFRKRSVIKPKRQDRMEDQAFICILHISVEEIYKLVLLAFLSLFHDF